MVVKIGGETDDQYAKEYNIGLLPRGHKSRVLFFVHAPAQARFGLYLCLSDCFNFFFPQVLGNKVKLPNTLSSKENPPC